MVQLSSMKPGACRGGDKAEWKKIFALGADSFSEAVTAGS